MKCTPLYPVQNMTTQKKTAGEKCTQPEVRCFHNDILFPHTIFALFQKIGSLFIWVTKCCLLPFIYSHIQRVCWKHVCFEHIVPKENVLAWLINTCNLLLYIYILTLNNFDLLSGHLCADWQYCQLLCSKQSQSVMCFKPCLYFNVPKSTTQAQ